MSLKWRNRWSCFVHSSMLHYTEYNIDADWATSAFVIWHAFKDGVTSNLCYRCFNLCHCSYAQRYNTGWCNIKVLISQICEFCQLIIMCLICYWKMYNGPEKVKTSNKCEDYFVWSMFICKLAVAPYCSSFSQFWKFPKCIVHFHWRCINLP